MQPFANFTFSQIIFFHTHFQGDSGGPVFEYQMKLGGGLEPVLIGIVDSSIEDCSTMLVTPTVLSNVGFYRSWIEKKMKI